MSETRGMILKIKVPHFFLALTHGAPTLVNIYTYVELNKYVIVECPCGKSMWQIHVANPCGSDDR